MQLFHYVIIQLTFNINYTRVYKRANIRRLHKYLIIV